MTFTIRRLLVWLALRRADRFLSRHKRQLMTERLAKECGRAG